MQRTKIQIYQSHSFSPTMLNDGGDGGDDGGDDSGDDGVEIDYQKMV